MLISFFEEFAAQQNLRKLKLVNWSARLYLAAPSLREFGKRVKAIQSAANRTKGSNRKHLTEFVYWPLLTKREGYWISPFSQRKALLRIFRELAGKKVPVMLDLELPTTQNPGLYLTQSFHFLSNKRLIQRFIHQYQGDVYLAEYYPEGKRKEQLLQFWGLHYPAKKVNEEWVGEYKSRKSQKLAKQIQEGHEETQKKVKVIKMLYHSLHPFREEFVRQELQRGKEEYGRNFLVAYGTMGSGVKRTELNISAQQLEKDLQLARRCGIGEVVLYRLGGMNGEYATVLRKFTCL